LRAAGPDSSVLRPGTRTDHVELVRSGIIAEIKELLDTIPIHEMALGNLIEGVGEDLFMETLVNNLKNDCVSYQVFINRTVSTTVANIESRLELLKENYDQNCTEIFTLEKKLDSINDAKLRNKLEGNRNYNIFNNEKFTPNFVNLSKGTKSEATLSDLRDDYGNAFESENDMKEYVRNFYKNLYKRPTVDSDFNENCIREFLGEDIVNSRLAQDSIIPAQLSLEFEAPLTLHELDISAGEGNRSASGMDGLSNCFIKRFWELLRIPLHRYATACHIKGSLTQNFSTASIKLMPKKGDATKIKNWRPISLLSHLYKVISRALNNRLKKATGYIFSRSQKGFTSDRHIQEVLINVVEMISHCKSNGISGAILSIDQAKAFDSISHKYMQEVFKFFGFGPNFTKLHVLETLGNNRTACIAFDDGSYSAPINLECGRAQGNTSSPTEYNMGQQILLFKIELCPEIKSLFQHHFISRPLQALAVEHEFDNPPPPPLRSSGSQVQE
jgi:hypothetical protein